MTFLHLSLLAGGLLAVIPILLHLWSQRPPKPITFPALRFVKQTVQTHRRSWQVRQWLLLALRALVLILMAFALARPNVHSDMLATWLAVGGVGLLAVLATIAFFIAWAGKRPVSIVAATGIVSGVLWVATLGWSVVAVTRGAKPPALQQDSPIAAVVIIDTSPSMDYKFSNQSRLDVAKELVGEWIQKLPSESKVAILTQSTGQFALDRNSALRQLDRVEIQYQASDLPSMIQRGVQLVRGENLERREVYVVTDMARVHWERGTPSELKGILNTEPSVLLQILDVGVETPQNWSIGDLGLSQSQLAPGGSVTLETTISRTEETAGDKVSVELLLENEDPNLPIIRDGKLVVPETSVVQRQFVDLSNATSGNVEFEIRDLPQGTQYYRVRLDRGDPLAFDDVRYLTLNIGEVGKLLVVGDGIEERGLLATILSAGGSEVVDECGVTELTNFPLERYEVIVLLDPGGMTEPEVAKVDRYVRDGGGLMTVMGSRLGSPESLQRSAISKLLPGSPERISRRSVDDRSVYFVPDRPSHAVFQYFGGRGADAPFNSLPVFRHWDLRLQEGVTGAAPQTLVRYSLSGLPAIVEQSLGRGRIVTWTTIVPESSDLTNRNPWNELTSSAEWWPTYGLILGSVRYLAGSIDEKSNYSVGQSAVLNNPSDRFPDQYRLFTPRGDTSKLDVRSGSVLIPNLQSPGVYRLRGVADRPVVRGVSVNSSTDVSELKRIQKSDLEAMLGAENCRVARDLSEVERSVGEARYGRELFPFLMLLVCALLFGEQWMANRFYQWNPGGRTKNRSGGRVAA